MCFPLKVFQDMFLGDAGLCISFLLYIHCSFMSWYVMKLPDRHVWVGNCILTKPPALFLMHVVISSPKSTTRHPNAFFLTFLLFTISHRVWNYPLEKANIMQKPQDFWQAIFRSQRLKSTLGTVTSAGFGHSSSSSCNFFWRFLPLPNH